MRHVCITLLLLVSICVFGCDEGVQMMTPVIIDNNIDDIVDVVDEPEPDPIPIIIPKHETVSVFIENTQQEIAIDVYEVSIGKYISVFPEYYDVLMERIKNVNPDRPLWLDDGFTNNDYPALVNYDDAVKYANAVDMRLPLVEEWLYAAAGDGFLGAGNVTPVFWWGFNRARIKPEPVNNNRAIPNGYKIYEMLGNASEWCGNTYENLPGLRAVMIPSWANIGQVQFIEHAKPGFSWTDDHPNVYEGFRLVKDMEKQ